MTQIKVELQEAMGNDRSIASAAWTSSQTHKSKKLKTDEQVNELVNRLANDRHSTPFESVVFRFWIKMPIATDRQFMTHRIQSSSGMSGRYRTMPNEYLDIPEEVDDLTYKITKSGLFWPNEQAFHLNPIEEYFEICDRANTFYNALLIQLKQKEKDGIITNTEYKRMREFYRGVLPQHNMTERVSIMNLRSFSNFMKLRNTENAQPEIHQVARLMLEEVKRSNVCPAAIEILEKNNWVI